MAFLKKIKEHCRFKVNNLSEIIMFYSAAIGVDGNEDEASSDASDDVLPPLEKNMNHMNLHESDGEESE